jgi:undecaprenyl phosphate-alpha-L-ara4N flippase subunit ArnF
VTIALRLASICTSERCKFRAAFGYDLNSMEMSHVSKRALVIGLALAIILDTAGQLLWKFCVASLPPSSDLWQIAESVLRQPLFIVLAGIFLCQLVNWMKVLEHADLSFVQPVTSLSYVTVCVLSAIWFDEHIGIAKTAGILCVLCGVWLVSRGEPSVQDERKTRP